MPDPHATPDRAATACKDCGSTENVHTHCAGTLPLCPDCLPNHVEPARATPDRAANFDPEGATEALFRRAATQRVLDSSDQGSPWLATAIHAELKMAWERGQQAGFVEGQQYVRRGHGF